MAKVLLINGSPHADGCTARALREVADTLVAEGVEAEVVHVGREDVRGCVACGWCAEHGRCVFDRDSVNEVAAKFEEADGLVVGSPVYYASPNGTLVSFMDRLMYSTQFSKHLKVGASVVSARRGGNSASFDALNKYFTICGMTLATGTYWNCVHGFTAEDVERDLEGLQNMRNLARNVAFLVKATADARERYGEPLVETDHRTSFHDGK